MPYLVAHAQRPRTGLAASELGMLAGGDRVEGTLFGNGERTGNLDIVTMALNYLTQGVDPNLDFSNIKEVRRVAEFCTELKVPERQPYSGDLVFTAFSGSHQDAIKKGFEAMKDTGQELFEVPYLTVDPADIGRQYDPVIRVNSQSGKGGVAFLVESELGYRLPRRLQIAFSKVIQEVTDQTGQEMSASEVATRFLETYVQPTSKLKYLSHKPINNGDESDLEKFLFTVSWDEDQHQITAEGNGPMDAFVHAIRDEFHTEFDVKDFQEHALESGSDSEAAAYVLVATPSGGELFGVGNHKSITKASILALVAAMNRSMA